MKNNEKLFPKRFLDVSLTAVPGSTFCARCDGREKLHGTGKTKLSDDQHRDVMVAFGHHLKRFWDVISSRGRRFHMLVMKFEDET